jgi:hypothetical protein
VYAPLRWVNGRTFDRAVARRFERLWEQRHRDVTGCSDNAFIPRVPNAGAVEPGPGGPVQVMHNGVKIRVGSYYGDEVTRILGRNRRGGTAVPFRPSYPHPRSRHQQQDRTTPPSTRRAAPLVADASGLHT